jgi:hypothetical protein
MFMATHAPTTREANPWSTPLRDLGLKIGGTPLEAILDSFVEELRQRGLTRVEPCFYLSTEWGVPFGSVSVAIPFYLARADLTRLHAAHGGFVEGSDAADVLRYLRHEMGHVYNYAYKLYEDPEWVQIFGDINRPYEEEYRVQPFSPDYVRHLPGWYAQKHPDEDWAETFAVWLTPGLDWRRQHAAAPGALAKLEFCDRTMARLRDQPPLVVVEEKDEDVGALSYSLEQFYQDLAPGDSDLSADLRGVLEEVFGHSGSAPQPAAELLRRLEQTLPAEVYRWTGHFPERTRVLLRRLAEQAERDGLTYPAGRELQTGVALTAVVTALAMNHILRGSWPTPNEHRPSARRE